MTPTHIKYWPPLKTDQLQAIHISTLKTDPNNLTQYTYYHTDGRLIVLYSFQIVINGQIKGDNTTVT